MLGEIVRSSVKPTVAGLEGAGELNGDAVRFTGTGGHRVTATAPAEILVSEMHAPLAA